MVRPAGAARPALAAVVAAALLVVAPTEVAANRLEEAGLPGRLARAAWRAAPAAEGVARQASGAAPRGDSRRHFAAAGERAGEARLLSTQPSDDLSEAGRPIVDPHSFAHPVPHSFAHAPQLTPEQIDERLGALRRVVDREELDPAKLHQCCRGSMHLADEAVRRFRGRSGFLDRWIKVHMDMVDFSCDKVLRKGEAADAKDDARFWATTAITMVQRMHDWLSGYAAVEAARELAPGDIADEKVWRDLKQNFLAVLWEDGGKRRAWEAFAPLEQTARAAARRRGEVRSAAEWSHLVRGVSQDMEALARGIPRRRLY